VDAHIEREPAADQVEAAVEMLKLLADQTRLRILWALLHGEHSVSNLADHVGAQPSAVSSTCQAADGSAGTRPSRGGTGCSNAATNSHVRRLVEEALFAADHLVGGLPDHDSERTPRRRRA